MSPGDLPDHQGTDADAGARRREAEALKHRALTDRRVLEKLRCVPNSATAAATAMALRERYLQTLEQRGDLLEELLQDTEAQRAQLQQQNQALTETLGHLRYKLKCANYELQKALGVKAATHDKDTGKKPRDTKGPTPRT